LRPGIRLDIDSIAAEREAFYNFMRNRGYFDFTRQHMHVDIDTSHTPGIASLRIHIENEPGQEQHVRYQIDSSYLTISHQNPARNLSEPTITERGGMVFTDYTGQFKAKALERHL